MLHKIVQRFRIKNGYFVIFLLSWGLQCSAASSISTLFKGDGSLLFSDTSLSIDEGGVAGVFNVTLAAKPTHDVSVSLAVSDSSEIVISPQNITFHSDDYNIPKVITVYGLADCITDGNQNVDISVTEVTSVDKRFRSSSHPSLLREKINVSVNDNLANTPELLILANSTTLTTTESGGDDKFLVTLSCPPAPGTSVTIGLSSSNTSEGIVDTSSTTLDENNYSTGSLVTVTGQSDCTLESDISYRIDATVTNDGGNPTFTGLSDSIGVVNQNVPLGKQLMITSTGIQVNRGNGSYNNFQAKLSCAATASMTVNVAVTNLPSGFLLHSPVANPYSIAIADWNKPVDIINQVTSDLDGAYSITLTPSDAAYPAETVYFEDSPSKRINITTNGLAAGKYYELQNFAAKTSISTNGASTWWATNNDPYAFKVSKQPAGQTCAVVEKPYGTITGVMTLTVNCVSGNLTARRINSIDDFRLDYRLYQGKTLSVPNTAAANDIFVINNKIYFENASKLYSINTDGTALTMITLGGTITGDVRHLVSDGTNVYFSDGQANSVIKASLDGTTWQSFPMGTNYPTDFPSGLALDIENQILYIAIRNTAVIRRLNLMDGTTTDITHAEISAPEGLLLINGVLYATNVATHRIIAITNPNGSTPGVSVIAGSSAGYRDGSLLQAQFSSPHGIISDGQDFYVTDYGNNRIRKIDLERQIVTTIAGSGALITTDNTGAQAEFSSPTGIATDGYALYVAESGAGGKIRKIVDNGLVGYWPLAGKFSDYSSDLGVNTVTGWTGTAAYTTGRYGEANAAGNFNGATYLSTKSNILNPNASFSLAAWIKISDISTSRAILGTASWRFMWNVGANGSMTFINWTCGGCVTDNGVTTAPGLIKSNTWTHVAYKYDPNDTQAPGGRLYINGHDVTKQSSANGGATDAIDVDVTIGYATASGYAGYMNGQIADVRMYNRALNDGEIHELAMTADSTLVGRGFNTGITGLLTHYNFQNSGLNDAGPLRHNLAGTGSFVRGIDGAPAAAMRFSATTEQVQSLNSFGLPINRQPRTICAWVKPANLPDSLINYSVAKYGGDGTTGSIFGITLYSNATGQKLGIGTGNNDFLVDYALPLNTWTHVCGSYDGTNAYVYINGRQAGYKPSWTTFTTSDVNPVSVGNASGETKYDISIDDVRIYNYALSGAEVRQLTAQIPAGLVAFYNFAGDATDSSGWSNDLYVVGNSTYPAPVLVEDRFGDNSAYEFSVGSQFRRFFETTSDLSDFNLPQAADAHSQCGWIKPDLTPGVPQDIDYLLKLGENSGTGGAAEASAVWYDYSTRKFVFSSVQGGVAAAAPMQSAHNIWHHVCMVYAGGANVVDFYVNGVKIASSGAANLNLPATQLRIGGADSGNYGGRWHGAMDEIRIYNRALTQSEILVLAGYHPMQTTVWNAAIGSSALQYHFDSALTTCSGALCTDGDLASYSADISGNGYDVAQVTSGSMPKYILAEPTLYNRPTLLFDGADDWLAGNGAGVVSQNHTLFVVSSNVGSGAFFSVGKCGAVYDKIFYYTGTRLAYDACYGGTATSGVGLTAGAGNITRYASDQTVPAGYFYVNGAGITYGSTPSYNTATSTNDFTIGSRLNSGGRSNLFSGMISEVIYFNQILPAADLQIVECYLSAKYGIAISPSAGYFCP